jgi:hypothetical protein
MAVIIKLNGEFIGSAIMSREEVIKAEKSGFTVIIKEGK